MGTKPFSHLFFRRHRGHRWSLSVNLGFSNFVGGLWLLFEGSAQGAQAGAAGLLLEIAKANPLVLAVPTPSAAVANLGDYAIPRRFREEGIEIPKPPCLANPA